MIYVPVFGLFDITLLPSSKTTFENFVNASVWPDLLLGMLIIYWEDFWLIKIR